MINDIIRKLRHIDKLRVHIRFLELMNDDEDDLTEKIALNKMFLINQSQFSRDILTNSSSLKQ